jgi:phenylacetate-CoA ligase
MPAPTPKTAVGSLAFPAFPGAEAARLLAIQHQLSLSERWQPAELRRAQALQLDLLLRHAAAEVPHYRERVTAALALPADDLAGRLAAIPVSTRSDLQASGAGLRAGRLPAEHGKFADATTTGSTGEPLRFARTSATNAVWLANALREYLWQGRDFSLKLGGIRMFPLAAADPGEEGMRHGNWGPSVATVYPTGPAAFLSSTVAPDGQLRWLQKERPDYLTSYPSNLVALADHAEARGIPLPRVREVRTIGETLSAESRSRLESAWGCRVTDAYTCEEAGYLALQCPAGTHYHVMAESVILEVLDDDGKPCPAGREGRVVVTHLTNFITPFIRYELGDFAVPGEPGACACGRTLPTLTRVLGRRRNRLTLPDGTKVFPTFGIWTMGKEFADAGLRRIRCIQRSTRLLEFVLQSERRLTEAEEARLREIALAKSAAGFEIAVSYSRDPAFWKEGKHEAFFSDLA